MAHTRHVLTELDDDWATLLGSPRTRQRLREWQHDHQCLAGPGDLGELIGRIRTAATEQSQEMVWALLALARCDSLAARTVLQAIVPGMGCELGWLISWASRVDPALLTDGDADQLLVVAALEAIQHATGKRRPWPLLSILRRTHRILVKATVAEAQWRGLAVLEEPPLPHCSVAAEPSPAEQLARVLGEAREQGAVTPDEAALVWLTRVGGYLPDELETRFAVRADSLRRRRHRAETRLSQWSQAV